LGTRRAGSLNINDEKCISLTKKLNRTPHISSAGMAVVPCVRYRSVPWTSIQGTILFKDRQCCNRDERILCFFLRDGLSIGRRPASPIKPPQGAYLSRVGTERCGNGFESYALLNELRSSKMTGSGMV